MRKLQVFAPENLDRNLAVVGIFISLGLIVYLLLSYSDRIVYLSTGFLALLACVLWLFMRRTASIRRVYLQSVPLFFSSVIAFFVLSTLMLGSFYFRPELYERPLLFFVFAALAAGTLALQILFCDLNRRDHLFILVQIILFSCIVIWSELFLYPNLVGIDPWAHQRFVTFIVENGHIPTDLSYSRLPLMHLEISSVSLFTGLPYKFATMISVSFLQISCGILFAFLIGRFLLNVKVGLFAGLLISLSNSFVGMGFWTTPTSIAAIVLLVVVFLLFKFVVMSPAVRVGFVSLFMVTLILTHTVTSMCLALILIVGLLLTIFFNRTYYRSKVLPFSLNVASFFSVAMFSWWIYVTGHIRNLADFVYLGFTADIFISAPEVVESYIATASQAELMFNQIGMFIFFALSFLGCFYMISRRFGNLMTLSYVFVGLTPLAVGFFSYISGYYLLPERWWYYAQVLLAVPLAITVVLFVNVLLKRRAKSAFLFGFVAVLSFLMLFSSTANIDNHLFAPTTGVRMALTESELASASFFADRSVGTLGSDYDFFTNPSSSIMVNYYDMNFTRVKSIDKQLLSASFKGAPDLIVIRHAIVRTPFRLFGQPYFIEYDPCVAIEEQGYSRIYDSDTVVGFYHSSNPIGG